VAKVATRLQEKMAWLGLFLSWITPRAGPP
jgi:hypothetical protein